MAPPSTMSWSTPLAAEVVEHRTQVAVELEAGVHGGAVGRVAEHDPERLGVVGAPLAIGEAHGEGGVVGPDRAGAHEDGVAVGPQPVGVEAGLRTGDPLLGAVGGGGAAVERRRQLQHDVGAAGAAVVEVGRQLLGGLVAPTPTTTSMPAARSRSMPCPATWGSGSVDGHHHPADAGGDHRVGAGRGAPWWEQGSRVT